MTIPPRFMDELRSRLSLSDIVGKRVKLARAGRELKGCCPFHREKTPSFYVNDDKQFYHCFGCGAHGDVIGFVMQHDNLSFVEAVETLAAQAGMTVPQQSSQEREKAHREKSLYSLVEDAALFFEERLYEPAARDALAYLQDRGITEDACCAYRIGYAPSDGQALYRHLKKQGYTDTQMIEAGLIRRSQRDGAPYSFFRERIIFPVADRRGRVVAFGGRILPDHLRPAGREGSAPPKYINSSDTPLFHKGRMLYGESHARQAAGDGQTVIVVEGYMDVIACSMAGYKGAVAPLGTALTEEQVAALWKMIPDGHKAPVLCFDGDEAGRRAAQRACGRILPLLRPDHTALFAFLPEGQDPDSLLRGQGPRALQAVLDAAVPLVDFLWSHHTAGRSFDTPEARAGLAAALEEEATRIGDRNVQHYYRQAFRERLYVFNRPKTRADTRRQPAGRGWPKSGAYGNVKITRPAFANHILGEQMLLAALLNHPVIFDQIEEELSALHFSKPRLDLLRQAAIQILGSNAALDRETLHNHLKDRGFEDELALLLSRSVYTHAGFAKPGTETETVIGKWRETWRLMHKEVIGDELRQAGQELAREINEENERKLLALHDVHKASEA